MLKTIITDFVPMRIPKVKGKFSITKLKKESFPLYVAPIPKGIEIIIRGGHPFINMYPFMILNTQFRTRFKSILELSAKRGFTLHAILTDEQTSKEGLFKILTTSNSLLPMNVKLIVTLCLYENASEEVLYKNSVDLIKAFIGSTQTPFIPNVEPANFTETTQTSKLLDIIHFLYENFKKTQEVLLLNKYGNYQQGRVSIENTNAVYLEPTEEKYGTIAEVIVSTKILPGENLQMADKLLIKFDNTVLPFSLMEMPLNLRGYLSAVAPKLIGKKVLCNILYIPNSEPKILELVKYNI